MVVNIPGLFITFLCIDKWILKKISQTLQDEEGQKNPIDVEILWKLYQEQTEVG